MSFDRGRHEAWEELISAAITGDVTADERRRVEAHVAGCASCRATWDAFDHGRRVVGGLRHYAPPRDLGARVRGGIEAGAFSRTPWWRRGPALFAGVGGGLAVVAGALLALVLLDDARGPEVGQSTPTPTVSIAATASAEPEATPQPPSSAAAGTPSPTPGQTLPPPPGPSEEPDPDATPTPIPTDPPALASSPEPDVVIAMTGPADNQALTVRDGTSGETIGEPEAPAEAPVAAAMTDDGEWLAFITRDQLRGFQAVRVSHLRRSGDPDEEPIAIEDTLPLNEEILPGNPFLDRLDWSRDGRYLAYTVADGENGTDAWVFDTELGEARQLTSTGNAYAASFVPPGDEDVTSARLWVSVADTQPTSYLVEIEDGALADWEPIDPAEVAVHEAENVFQPLVSPNGALVIYWNGEMGLNDQAWEFIAGGSPQLAEHQVDEAGDVTIANERGLFGDLTIDRDAFASAGVTWGPDGVSIAVWGAEWEGLPQVPEGAYPDARQVYFGRATDPGGLTSAKAIENLELPDDARVIDVKVAPTLRHVLVTVAYSTPGDLAALRADLFIVEVIADGEDVVELLNEGAEGWIGPAAYSAPEADSSQAP